MFQTILSSLSWRVVHIGLLSGIFMGLFFGVVEWLGNISVYTLLMNVDYIPGFKHWEVPGWLEFSLHMLVSIAVCASVWIANSFKVWGDEPRTKQTRISFAMVLIGIFLYPTTLLAVQAQTPAIDDWAAWCVWLIGHLGYGVYLSKSV